MAQSPEHNRFRLGRELNFARKAAGRTQHETAVGLGFGQGKVSKIEHGTVNITWGDLTELMHYYQVAESKRTELLELHRNAIVPRTERGDRPRPEAFVKLISVETDAEEILSWHSERIPGPLQHTRYMLKQFELDQPGKRQAVRSAVAERTSRLDLFTVDNAPRYRVILSESSLFRLPGGWSPDLELDQIRNLQMLLSDYPQFELRILQFTASISNADTDFAVLRFASDALVPHKDFVYLEHVADANTVEDSKEIDVFVDYWDKLAAAALDREETIAFLGRRAEMLEASKAC